MEKVTLCGPMEEDTKVNINKIKNRGMGYFIGQMAENMMDIGHKENNMGMENILTLKIS